MVIAYLGQRQVEVGALNASFEPVRARLDGRGDPQAPGSAPKVRLHVPEAWLTHQSRKRSVSPELRKQSTPSTMPDKTMGRLNEASTRSCNGKSPEINPERQLTSVEECVLQGIYLAGFADDFEKLQSDHRHDVLVQLQQGLMSQMHTIFQSHSRASSSLRKAPSVPEVAASLETASRAQTTRAATAPDLQVGHSLSRRHKSDQHRQPKTEAYPPGRPMNRFQQAPAPHRPASSAEHAAVAKQAAPERALQGFSSLQHSLQQHQQHQQLARLQQAQQMRGNLDALGQSRTWPDLPLVNEQKGTHGKGFQRVGSQMNMSATKATSTPTTQVHSMESLPWHSENSQQRATTMSMESLPHMAVRSMDSLPYPAAATLDSLPEIAENSTEDLDSLQSSPYMSFSSTRMESYFGSTHMGSFGSAQEQPPPSMASGGYAPQPRTCPNLPDFSERVDSSLRASSLPRVMLELQTLESSNEMNAMRQMQSFGQQFSRALRQPNSRKPCFTPQQASLMSAMAAGFKGSLPTSQAMPSSSSEANRKVLKPGPLPQTAGDMSSFSRHLLPPNMSPPPGLTMDNAAEPPMPPLPLSLLPGGDRTYSL